MKLSTISLRLSFIGIALISVSIAASAQSISDYRKAHRDLLAKQEKIKNKIQVKEGDNADIYSEAWNDDRVNPYQNANIPSTKIIDVSRYAMPVKHKVVNSHYGYRKQFGRMHRGVDLKASVGDTVYAAFSGKVRLAKFERNGYGFFVVVRHDNGLETVYGHLSKFLVKPNQFVKAGTPIALSGNTGRSTGPHLHFETRFMGIDINPEKIFDFVNGSIFRDSFTFNKNENNSGSTGRKSASRRRR